MKRRLLLLVFCLFMMSDAGITQHRHKARHGVKKKRGSRYQYGVASFYSNRFIGRKTANGNRYSQMKLTAAHNHVPLGTLLRVTNLKNKRKVIVRVTDRLHRRNRRMIDLSRAAATELGTPAKGLLKVRVEIVGKTKPYAKQG